MDAQEILFETFRWDLWFATVAVWNMEQQQEKQDSVNWTRFGLDPNVDRPQSQSHARPSSGTQIVNAPSTAKYDEANTTVKELFDEEQVRAAL